MFEDTKRKLEAINRKRPDNTMANRYRTKRQCSKKNLAQKTKDSARRTPLKIGVNLGALEG